MSRHGFARSFTELVVYQKARAFSRLVFEVSKDFPKEEDYSLTSQIRRSARSIGAQIAESWAKRRYEKHFVSKLTDADGEQMETLHWIITAEDCGYLDENLACELRERCEEIGRIIGKMIRVSGSFCNADWGAVQEAPPEYGSESSEPLEDFFESGEE